MSLFFIIFIVYLIRHHERRTNTKCIQKTYILFLHKYPSYVCVRRTRIPVQCAGVDTYTRTHGYISQVGIETYS